MPKEKLSNAPNLNIRATNDSGTWELELLNNNAKLGTAGVEDEFDHDNGTQTVSIKVMDPTGPGNLRVDVYTLGSNPVQWDRSGNHSKRDVNVPAEGNSDQEYMLVRVLKEGAPPEDELEAVIDPWIIITRKKNPT